MGDKGGVDQGSEWHASGAVTRLFVAGGRRGGRQIQSEHKRTIIAHRERETERERGSTESKPLDISGNNLTGALKQHGIRSMITNKVIAQVTNDWRIHPWQHKSEHANNTHTSRVGDKSVNKKKLITHMIIRTQLCCIYKYKHLLPKHEDMHHMLLVFIVNV